MSMRSNDQEVGRVIGRFAFSILGGLLLASQLVLPSHAFALSVRTTNSADPPTSQSFALSEVSVVRLVYSYSAKPATKGTTAGTPVLCTSVGVLVKSIPASTSSTLNTSVLTDGSLLNTAPAPCAPAGSNSRSKTSTTYALSSINVYANDAYTGNAPAHALLGTYTVAATNAPLCIATPCMNGAFFFSFHTEPATANTQCSFDEYAPAIWDCIDFSSLSDGSPTDATSKYSSSDGISQSHTGHT